jgi:dTDP-4-dehydrorhamnose 3,5-epimerase
VQPQDPALAISWPLPLAEISARDAQHALLTHEFTGLTS